MTTGKKFLIALSAFAILAGVAAGRSPISSGLVLWFRSGPSTAKFKDLSHNKNNGNGGTIVVPDSASLDSMTNTHQLTLALWIKPSSIPSEFPDLIAKGSNQQPNAYGGYELLLNANGDNDLVFVTGGFYADTHGANGSLINNHLGEWIHVAFTMDTDAQTAQFYVDGQAYTNDLVSGTFADVNFGVTNNLYVGRPDPNAPGNRVDFDGDMRNIMVFNRALSADEIQTIFNTTQPRDFTAPSAN